MSGNYDFKQAEKDANAVLLKGDEAALKNFTDNIQKLSAHDQRVCYQRLKGFTDEGFMGEQSAQRASALIDGIPEKNRVAPAKQDTVTPGFSRRLSETGSQMMHPQQQILTAQQTIFLEANQEIIKHLEKRLKEVSKSTKENASQRKFALETILKAIDKDPAYQDGSKLIDLKDIRLETQYQLNQNNSVDQRTPQSQKATDDFASGTSFESSGRRSHSKYHDLEKKCQGIKEKAEKKAEKKVRQKAKL